MKNLLLLFAWLPLLMLFGFNSHGSNFAPWLLWSIWCLWLCLEACEFTARYHSELSHLRVTIDYEIGFNRAMCVKNLDDAREILSAHEMFLKRGVA